MQSQACKKLLANWLRPSPMTLAPLRRSRRSSRRRVLEASLAVVSFSAQDSYDYEQVAGEAEHGSQDDSAGREDVGTEGLLGAARAGHKEVASGDEGAGCDEDVATGDAGQV